MGGYPNVGCKPVDVCAINVYFINGYDNNTSGSRGARSTRRSGRGAWPSLGAELQAMLDEMMWRGIEDGYRNCGA